MSEQPKSPAPFQPTPGSLAGLVALGVLSALLSLFLWAELLLARAGGQAFCALSEPDACARLWDGSFAVAIHRWSGLPIAGWGLAWALAALALPLLALQRAAQGKPDAALLSAVRVLAAGGVVAVCVLLAAALQARSFCSGCFLSYVLAFGYAGIALFGWQPLGLPRRQRGVALAVGSLAAAFVLLLYPGRSTPSTRDAAALAAITSPAAGAPVAGSDAVSQLVASLQPGLRQTLSDALYLYKGAIALPPGPARALVGPEDAPLRITDFTDVRCDHCAELHETLRALEREAPGRFSVEARQFPLDAECNPYVQKGGDPVRCLAARARICAEGRPGASEFATRLFAKQETLSSADVYAFAAGLQPRAELEACLKSPETAAKLKSDVELAVKYELEGTPLVLLNGRKAVSFPPFLYAMVLAGGRTDHPAFQALPPPNPQAHLH